MQTNRKKKIIIFLSIVLCIGGILWSRYEENIFNEENIGKMYELNAEAMSENKERFYNYKVVEMPEKSNELIAVEFNTDNQQNVGFIDEYGNVIREPFLENPEYDYYETHKGESEISKFEGDYFQDKYTKSVYDRNFELVKNKDIQNLFQDNKRKSRRIRKKEFDEIDKSLKHILTKKQASRIGNYDSNVPFWEYKDGIYTLFISEGFFWSVDFILDSNYNLASHFYFRTDNKSFITWPDNSSKVGCAFVVNLGKVYFNDEGEIIWITYAKE